MDGLVTEAEQAANLATRGAAPLSGDISKLGISLDQLSSLAKELETLAQNAMTSCSNCTVFIKNQRPEMEKAKVLQGDVANAIRNAQPRVAAAIQASSQILQRAAALKMMASKGLATGMPMAALAAGVPGAPMPGAMQLPGGLGKAMPMPGMGMAGMSIPGLQMPAGMPGGMMGMTPASGSTAVPGGGQTVLPKPGMPALPNLGLGIPAGPLAGVPMTLPGMPGATPPGSPIGQAGMTMPESMMPKSKSQGFFAKVGMEFPPVKAPPAQGEFPPPKAPPPPPAAEFPLKAAPPGLPETAKTGFSKGFSKASMAPGMHSVPKGQAAPLTAPLSSASSVDNQGPAALKEKAEALGKALMDLGTKIGEVEQLAAKLRDTPGQLQAQVLSAEELTVQREVRERADSSCKSLRSELGTLATSLDALRADVANLAQMTEVVGGLDKGRHALEQRLQKVMTVVQKSQRAAQLDVFVASESSRVGVAAKLRECVEDGGQNVDTLFDAIDSNSRGSIGLAEIRDFLQRRSKQLQPSELETFLVARDGSRDIDVSSANTVSLDRAAFSRQLRIYYKVEQPSAISDALQIQNCKELRQMGKGEIFELIEGPKRDDSDGSVTRIRGRAWRDGLVGWATVSREAGAPSIVAGSGVMKAVHLVPITNALEAGAVVRHTFDGELLQVVEWTQRSINGKNLAKVRVWAMSDGITGWVTLSEDGGPANLEAI